MPSIDPDSPFTEEVARALEVRVPELQEVKRITKFSDLDLTMLASDVRGGGSRAVRAVVPLLRALGDVDLERDKAVLEAAKLRSKLNAMERSWRYRLTQPSVPLWWVMVPIGFCVLVFGMAVGAAIICILPSR